MHACGEIMKATHARISLGPVLPCLGDLLREIYYVYLYYFVQFT
jgi:hypothetical protein